MLKSFHRIAITGGRGFLGQHLIQRLQQLDIAILSFVRENTTQLQSYEVGVDLSNIEQVTSILHEFKPTETLYLAAQLSPGRSLNDFSDHFQNSIQPMCSFAQSIPKNVKASFFFGSCEEYGNGPTPFKEEQSPVCFSSYGWSKISSYFAVSYILTERKIPWVWARPFLMFGPGQRSNLFLPQIIRACILDESIPLTEGQQTRDFIFVNDVANMILQMINKPEKALGSILNLASGQPRKLRDVGDLIAKLTAKPHLLNWGSLPYRTNEAMSFYASTEKWKQYYGPFVLSDWENSLQQTIEEARSFYKAN